MPETIQFPVHELRGDSLEIWRGNRRLCRNISFSLKSGQVATITGPNGSGKTSLLRVLVGLGYLESGTVYWNDQTLRAAGSSYREALSYLGHLNGIKLALTPRENLLDVSVGADRHDRVAAALERVGMTRFADQLCGHLSMGQRRRTALARLLINPTPLWLMDEPGTSLDTDGVALIGECVTEHVRSQGIALIATHQTLPLDDCDVVSITIGKRDGQ